MDPTSLIPAGLAILVALLTCRVLAEKSGPTDAAGRYVSIDGLRGYLAFFVFLHHAVIWYFYLKTGKWTLPPSNAYTHFGKGGVAFFFMITGFLFYRKILEGRHKGVDWLRLYVSRFLRLMPAYAVAMLALFLTVIVVSGGELREPVFRVLHEVLDWLAFTMLDSPDINGVKYTSMMVAGVTWSLPYEWLFYLFLPLLAVPLGMKVSFPVLGLSALAFAFAWSQQFAAINWLCFSGGVVAAFVVRSEVLCNLLRKPAVSVLALAVLGLTVALFPTPQGFLQIALLSFVFVIVAAGNDLFGILSWRVSRTLGDMAYSIYLMHGLLLYVMFQLVIGADRARTLSPEWHWAIVIGMVPVLIGFAHFSYRKIESPALSKTNEVTHWLRSRFADRVAVQK